MTDPNQFPQIAEAPQGLSVMENFRNSRLGRIVTAGVASLTLASGTEAAALAFAEPVSADNPPALYREPEATPSKAIPECTSPDSDSQYPQWRASYNFKTPNGEHRINSVHPGGLARFVARVAGGNVKLFNMEALVAAPMYKFPKDMEVLKRGSHPGWYPGGGNPTWPLKDLCHWTDKRNISFLVKIGRHAQLGKRLCLPFDEWAKVTDTYYPTGNPPIQHRCLKVD